MIVKNMIDNRFFVKRCHFLSASPYLYKRMKARIYELREKMIMAILIIGTWMTATANAGNMEVVSTHRIENGEGAMREVTEDIDIVLNQWPVWDRQKLSEHLVQEYLNNTFPGVCCMEIADTLVIHVYLTRRSRRRNRLFCTVEWEN